MFIEFTWLGDDAGRVQQSENLIKSIALWDSDAKSILLAKQQPKIENKKNCVQKANIVECMDYYYWQLRIVFGRIAIDLSHFPR